jgi:hypothetical protein
MQRGRSVTPGRSEHMRQSRGRLLLRTALHVVRCSSPLIHMPANKLYQQLLPCRVTPLLFSRRGRAPSPSGECQPRGRAGRRGVAARFDTAARGHYSLDEVGSADFR